MGQENLEKQETETETTPPAEGGTPPATPPEGEGISNADLKANPTFQKVTGELAQLRQEKADREAAAEKRKLDDERTRLESEGKYEEALKLRDTQLEEQKAKYEKDILQRDLKNELLSVGFTNNVFVKGAIGDFDGGSDGVADYVKGLAGKDENKVFLGTPKRNTLNEPKPPSGTVKNMSLDEARRQAKESNDPAVRTAARKVIAADYNQKYSQ